MVCELGGEVCPGDLAEQDLDICNTGVSNLEVASVAFNPPCDDPMILEPGTYRVTAKITNRFGLLETKQIQFELSYCDFWHDARIDFN